MHVPPPTSITSMSITTYIYTLYYIYIYDIGSWGIVLVAIETVDWNASPPCASFVFEMHRFEKGWVSPNLIFVVGRELERAG